MSVCGSVCVRSLGSRPSPGGGVSPPWGWGSSGSARGGVGPPFCRPAGGAFPLLLLPYQTLSRLRSLAMADDVERDDAFGLPCEDSPAAGLQSRAEAAPAASEAASGHPTVPVVGTHQGGGNSVASPPAHDGDGSPGEVEGQDVRAARLTSLRRDWTLERPLSGSCPLRKEEELHVAVGKF